MVRYYFEEPLELPLVPELPEEPDVPLPEDLEEPLPDMLEPEEPLAPELSPARRSHPVNATLSAATTRRTDEVLAMDFIVVPFIKMEVVTFLTFAIARSSSFFVKTLEPAAYRPQLWWRMLLRRSARFRAALEKRKHAGAAESARCIKLTIVAKV